jgi:hypothetical protein
MVQLELGAHSWTSRQKQGHDNNMEGKRETVIFRKKSVDRKPRKYLPNTDILHTKYSHHSE